MRWNIKYGGKTYSADLEGDAPPTESELNEFADHYGIPKDASVDVFKGEANPQSAPSQKPIFGSSNYSTFNVTPEIKQQIAASGTGGGIGGKIGAFANEAAKGPPQVPKGNLPEDDFTRLVNRAGAIQHAESIQGFREANTPQQTPFLQAVSQGALQTAINAGKSVAKKQAQREATLATIRAAQEREKRAKELAYQQRMTAQGHPNYLGSNEESTQYAPNYGKIGVTNPNIGNGASYEKAKAMVAKGLGDTAKAPFELAHKAIRGAMETGSPAFAGLPENIKSTMQMGAELAGAMAFGGPAAAAVFQGEMGSGFVEPVVKAVQSGSIAPIQDYVGALLNGLNPFDGTKTPLERFQAALNAAAMLFMAKHGVEAFKAKVNEFGVGPKLMEAIAPDVADPKTYAEIPKQYERFVKANEGRAELPQNAGPGRFEPIARHEQTMSNLSAASKQSAAADRLNQHFVDESPASAITPSGTVEGAFRLPGQEGQVDQHDWNVLQGKKRLQQLRPDSPHIEDVFGDEFDRALATTVHNEVVNPGSNVHHEAIDEPHLAAIRDYLNSDKIGIQPPVDDLDHLADMVENIKSYTRTGGAKTPVYDNVSGQRRSVDVVAVNPEEAGALDLIHYALQHANEELRYLSPDDIFRYNEMRNPKYSAGKSNAQSAQGRAKWEQGRMAFRGGLTESEYLQKEFGGMTSNEDLFHDAKTGTHSTVYIRTPIIRQYLKDLQASLKQHGLEDALHRRAVRLAPENALGLHDETLYDLAEKYVAKRHETGQGDFPMPDWMRGRKQVRKVEPEPKVRKETNAIQEQKPNEEVLRGQRPEVELQGMGERSAQSEGVAAKGQAQEVAPETAAEGQKIGPTNIAADTMAKEAELIGKNAPKSMGSPDIDALVRDAQSRYNPAEKNLNKSKIYKLLEDVKESGRPPSDQEQVDFALHKARLASEVNRIFEERADAVEKTGSASHLDQSFKDAIEEQSQFDHDSKFALNRWHRLGMASQALIDPQDYSFAGMMKKFQGQTGRRATPAEVAEMTALRKQLVDAIAERDKAQAEAEIARMARDAKQSIPKSGKRTSASLAEERKSLVEQFKANKGSVAGSGFGAFQLTDAQYEIIGKLAKNIVESGVVKLEEVIKAIKGHLGDLPDEEIRKGIIWRPLVEKSEPSAWAKVRAHAKAIEDLNAKIADLNERIANRDASRLKEPTVTDESKLPPDVQKLRQERAEAMKQRAEMMKEVGREQKLEELKRKIRSGDYKAPEAEERPEPSQKIKNLDKQIAMHQKRLDQLIDNATPKNLMDKIIAWRRDSLLTSINIGPKLLLAVITKPAVTVAGDAMWAPLSRLPGFKQLSERADIEGRASFGNNWETMKSAVSRDMAKQMWQKFDLGYTDIDLVGGKHARGNQMMTLKNGIDWETRRAMAERSHGALKAPAQKFGYDRAMANLIDSYSRKGIDVTDPDVFEALKYRAYDEGQRAQYMNQNAIVKQIDAAAAKSPVLRAAVGWFMAFKGIRTNILSEVLSGIGGGVPATSRLIKAIASGKEAITPEMRDTLTFAERFGKMAEYGMSKLSPDEANAIVRLYKNQGIGIGTAGLIVALRAAGVKVSASVYSKSVKSEDVKKGDAEPGDVVISIGDHAMKIPHSMVHTPVGYLTQMICHIGEGMGQEYQSGKKKGESKTNAAMGDAAMVLLGETPGINEAIKAHDYSSKGELPKYAGEQVGTLIPTSVAQVSKWTDSNTKRDAKGFMGPIIERTPARRLLDEKQDKSKTNRGNGLLSPSFPKLPKLPK